MIIINPVYCILCYQNVLRLNNNFLSIFSTVGLHVSTGKMNLE